MIKSGGVMKKLLLILNLVCGVFVPIQSSNLFIDTENLTDSEDTQINIFGEIQECDEWPDLNILSMERAATIFNPFSKNPVSLDNKQLNDHQLNLVIKFLKEAKKFHERCSDVSLVQDKSLKICNSVANECRGKLLKIKGYVDKIFEASFLCNDDVEKLCHQLQIPITIAAENYIVIKKHCSD